jgi:hypothetical protein
MELSLCREAKYTVKAVCSVCTVRTLCPCLVLQCILSGMMITVGNHTAVFPMLLVHRQLGYSLQWTRL